MVILSLILSLIRSFDLIIDLSEFTREALVFLSLYSNDLASVPSFCPGKYLHSFQRGVVFLRQKAASEWTNQSYIWSMVPRTRGVSWTDSHNRLWLFGGLHPSL